MTGLHGVLFIALLATGVAQPSESDPLDAVRQLYASADYESALAALERLPPNGTPAAMVEAQRYRALCLIALGRTADAEQVIEQIVRIDPSYQPDEQEAPRIRAAFASVRARILPLVARAHYADAKAAYERRDFKAAASAFERTIAVIDTLESDDPALVDLRTIARGFGDLSRAAVATAAPGPAPAATPKPAAEPTPPPTPEPEAKTDTTDTPTGPVVIQQTMPPWNPAWFGSQYQSEFRGAVEVTIDEQGVVTAARIVEPVHPAYDPQLLDAATRWRYEPARRGSQPVVSVKRVDIVLRPRE
jgi:TonB family protein